MRRFAAPALAFLMMMGVAFAADRALAPARAHESTPMYVTPAVIRGDAPCVDEPPAPLPPDYDREFNGRVDLSDLAFVVRFPVVSGESLAAVSIHAVADDALGLAHWRLVVEDALGRGVALVQGGPRLDAAYDGIGVAGTWTARFVGDGTPVEGSATMRVHVGYTDRAHDRVAWDFAGWSKDGDKALPLDFGFGVPRDGQISWPASLGVRGLQLDVRDAMGNTLSSEGYAYPSTAGVTTMPFHIPPEARGGSVLVRDLGASEPYAWDMRIATTSTLRPAPSWCAWPE